MTPPLSRSALEAFDRMRGLSAIERTAALAGDDTLSDAERDAVRSLLEHDGPTGEFLGAPVGRVSSVLVEPLLARSLPPVQQGYTILRPIGRGGFATVFLAEQGSPRRLVAIKVLPAGAGDSQVRRFQFEAEALARLNHPNVAGVFELASYEGQHCLVMEYVDGAPLDACAQVKSLGVNERLRLLMRICDGLAHVHQRGVLHRDLAPKNILVTAHGVPKIVDFGLAVDSSAYTNEALRVTLPGSVIGTLRYISPEQLRGDAAAVGVRSDLYALGVIAFELLVGRHPYLNEVPSLGAAVRQLEHAPLAPVSASRLGLPQDLVAVLRRAVDRDPARRYQSAVELGDDLLRVVERRPVAAIPWSWTYRATKFCARNRGLVVASAVAVTALATAIAGAVGSIRREMSTRDSALSALDIVVGRLLSPLGPRIGTLEERERLLLDIEPAILRMRERSGESPRVLKLYADYKIARSDIHRDRGRDDASLADAAEAARVYALLRSRSQESAPILRAYSSSLAKLGDAQRRLGQVEAGMCSYQQALAVDTAAVRAHPDDLAALNTLYWSLTRFAEATGVKATFDQSYTDRAWAISDRMQKIDAGNWRSLETLVHSRFGRFIRQPDAERDFALLMEAEAAVARLVVADPESAVHNAKRLLILTTVLKAPHAAIAESERTRCRRQAFEVEALLLKNQAETRIEDRALIDFRSCLREIASRAGDDADVAGQCEKLLEYTLHQAGGGFGAATDLESGYDTLKTWYLPALLRIDPEHAQARYSLWLRRLQAVATSRFPGSDVTSRLLNERPAG